MLFWLKFDSQNPLIHLLTPSHIVKNIDKKSTINSLTRGGVSEVGKFVDYFWSLPLWCVLCFCITITAQLKVHISGVWLRVWDGCMPWLDMLDTRGLLRGPVWRYFDNIPSVVSSVSSLSLALGSLSQGSLSNDVTRLEIIFSTEKASSWFQFLRTDIKTLSPCWVDIV